MMLTVGIPAYNNPEALIRALDSVIKQTFTDYEILISDDHSPNSLRGAIAQWQAAHPNTVLRYTFQEKNLGIVGNKRWLINSSNGTLFAFLEHDDYLVDPNFYQEVVGLYKSNKNVKIFIANSYLESPLPNELLNKKNRPKHSSHAYFTIYNPGTLMGHLVRNNYRQSLPINWSSVVAETQMLIEIGALTDQYITVKTWAEKLKAFHDEENMVFIPLAHEKHCVAFATQPVSFRTLGETSFSKIFNRNKSVNSYPNNIEFINYFRASSLLEKRLNRYRFKLKAISVGLKSVNKDLIEYLNPTLAEKVLIYVGWINGFLLQPVLFALPSVFHRVQRFNYLMFNHPKYFRGKLREKIRMLS